MSRKLFALVAVVSALLVVAPAASADHKHKGGWYYGVTTLDVDPATLEALGSLGVTPGAVEPARLDGARYAFPIVTPFRDVLGSGVISHRGGISLTAGDTTVELTDFDINLVERKLYGKVNGAGPVPLLDLDYSRLEVRARYGKLKIGPVGTTLTPEAAEALNAAFGTDALTDDTVIGDVKIRYRL